MGGDSKGEKMALYYSNKGKNRNKMVDTSNATFKPFAKSDKQRNQKNLRKLRLKKRSGSETEAPF